MGCHRSISSLVFKLPELVKAAALCRDLQIGTIASIFFNWGWLCQTLRLMCRGCTFVLSLARAEDVFRLLLAGCSAFFWKRAYHGQCDNLRFWIPLSSFGAKKTGNTWRHVLLWRACQVPAGGYKIDTFLVAHNVFLCAGLRPANCTSCDMFEKKDATGTHTMQRKSYCCDLRRAISRDVCRLHCGDVPPSAQWRSGMAAWTSGPQGLHLQTCSDSTI